MSRIHNLASTGWMFDSVLLEQKSQISEYDILEVRKKIIRNMGQIQLNLRYLETNPCTSYLSRNKFHRKIFAVFGDPKSLRSFKKLDEFALYRVNRLYYSLFLEIFGRLLKIEKPVAYLRRKALKISSSKSKRSRNQSRKRRKRSRLKRRKKK